jgi:ABC-type transport system involved in multi-copper enzyme maturation permease subunit
MPDPPGLRDSLAIEWYKLRRRPLPWLLLGAMLAFVVLANLAFLLLALAPPVTPGVAAATAALRQLVAPPNSLYVTLSSVNQVGAMLAIILGATVAGGEQHWGTLRLMLTRQPDRRRYLGGLLLALALALLAGLLAVALAGLLVSLGVALAGGLPVAWADLAAALTGPAYYRSLALSYAALLIYLLLGVAVTLLTRSLPAGLGASFAYYLVDAILVTNALGLVRDALVALPGLGPLVAFGSRLLLGYNLALIHGAASSQLRLDGAAAGLIEATAFPWPSLAVVAAHALLLAVIPFVALQRRDLGAPG